MATSDTRAQYVAVSNTVIGVAMLFAGSVGLLTGWLGLAGVIALLGSLSLIAAFYGLHLNEISG